MWVEHSDHAIPYRPIPSGVIGTLTLCAVVEGRVTAVQVYSMSGKSTIHYDIQIIVDSRVASLNVATRCNAIFERG